MTNREAIGYMLLAAKEVGFNKEQTKKLYRSMYFKFDIFTEEEAEEKGFECYYQMEDDE